MAMPVLSPLLRHAAFELTLKAGFLPARRCNLSQAPFVSQTHECAKPKRLYLPAEDVFQKRKERVTALAIFALKGRASQLACECRKRFRAKRACSQKTD